ncbi:MAG TPA: dipeptide ABC transporter ATP-binding protein [Dongiaceae bacterium]|jgi:dipeptide transport system ATP-binding protein|nr:dipeptide ABC transporter ATP-binding protein [Dongiaceae bacterium]
MAEPLLRVRDVKRHYTVKTGLWTRAVLRAVDGVSFDLSAGQTLAIVGESGCGKSTLARLLSLIEKPTAGEITIAGRKADISERQAMAMLRSEVQMVFQDPFGSLNPRKQVGQILEEPLEINTPLGRKQREAAARDIMARVGLRPEHYNRYPHMFSGGQRQRIAIARALMLRPKIVVADEPVSALDVSVRAQVLNLLMDLQEELGLAYVFISHDLSVVRHIADTVMVMYLGRPVEVGAKEDIFSRPSHPYTRALLAATPTVDSVQRSRRVAAKGELPSPLNPPAGCAYHKRCLYATDRCSVERPELRPLARHWVSCHEAGEGISFATEGDSLQNG